MKQGERRFRVALRRLRRPRRRWPPLPALTPGQWFRLVLLVLGIVAALLGIEGELVQGLMKLLVK